MKKILYISDFTFDVYNSVNDILYNIVNHKEIEKYTNIICKTGCEARFPLNKQIYYGKYKTYTAPEQGISYLIDPQYKLSEKIRCFYRRILYSISTRTGKQDEFLKDEFIKYIDNVIKLEKPDLVVFFTYDPNVDFVNICLKRKIPYISVLYDTYIERPRLNIEKGYAIERYVIENSNAHFIPSFFYDGYVKYYNNNKVKEFNLPLCIDKERVKKAYAESDKEFDFAYFGQIQAFRNGDKVKDIFRRLGLKLDIFSSFEYENDDVYISHPALTQDDLYKVVAGSKFLVAMDNSAPYNNYLPSKAYLYSSFTKPVIAIGDNEESALKSFFKDYKYFYYQDINQPLDGLKSFIDNTTVNCFDNELYEQYNDFLPENALKPLVETMEEILRDK